MTNQELDIVKNRIKLALEYLYKAQVFDTCGQHDESKEHVSLAISKLSFLLDWMYHLGLKK